jgi:hypothetical protein
MDTARKFLRGTRCSASPLRRAELRTLGHDDPEPVAAAIERSCKSWKPDSKRALTVIMFRDEDCDV